MVLNFIKLCKKFKCFNILKIRSFTNTERAIVLGLETSCDDTGCAVIDGKGNILGESLYSQSAIHVKFGGVNPVNAWELHRDNIEHAVNDALNSAKLTLSEIDAIAVTSKPGLLLCLSVGVKYANYLAKMYKKPVIPVHHMEAHALVARVYYDIPFPYLTLLISGGHCLLAVVNDVDNYLLLGETLDNAPGEVMDKAARRMKLKNISAFSSISGGRAIELASKNATCVSMFNFPTPLQKNRDCDFSFSGLKDSLVQKLLEREKEHRLKGDEIIPEVFNLCAAFQLGIGSHLAHRLVRAIKFCEIKKLLHVDERNIVVSGGVACNNTIYSILENVSNQLGYKLYRPPHKACTDNGVMIAWNGVEKIKKNIDMMSQIPLSEINPTASFGVNITDQVKEARIQVRTPKLIVP
ncbi:tRNA N6-adenosine threonylcarbamoyltransferase, mitochondrial-like [Battus philenor]|uniref:tRNA N6-adenosine threonylcarbamoyltransferase, mitochondrial-like n=1 Tax=Battus philenor TaxID=42288 RepID=UPI0035D090F0